MKLIEGMNYRQWQKRNTEHFNSLAKTQQKQARQQGYCNIGWEQVQNSWKIIYKPEPNVSSLFEHKLRKGDIIGAIELSILEADKAKHLARQAIKSLEKNQQYFDKLADETLAKYPLL
jgi:hypothetical protein